MVGAAAYACDGGVHPVLPGHVVARQTVMEEWIFRAAGALLVLLLLAIGWMFDGVP